ncbi:MAG: RNA polymerase sigma factor [Phycisphaerae bacterium]
MDTTSDDAGRAPRFGKRQFAEEFARCFRILWFIAVGILRDPALAEDAVQDAALIALDKLDAFEPGTNFTAWMGRMVRNVALNNARKEHRRQASPLDVMEQGEVAAAGRLPTQPRLLDDRGRLVSDQQVFDDRVVAALDGVGDMARACLLLRTVEGLDYAEIARVLDIPQGTAMSHVHRARTLLRKTLGGTIGSTEPERRGRP